MSRLTIIADSHILSSAVACERYHELTHVLHYQPKGLNIAQSRGTHLHNLLYLFYKQKMKKQPFNVCVNAGLRYLRIAGKKMDAEAFMLLSRKYAEYCGYYRSENIQPLAVEKGFSKIIYEDEYFLFIYEGRIDFIGKFPNDPMKYWVDHKTEARKEDLNPNSFQFIGYSWALETNNGLINYIGFQESKGPSEAFRRTIITHKRNLIEEWKQDAINIFFRMAALHIHGIYLKYRTNCKHYSCSPCVFHEVCNETNPRIINAILQKDFVVRDKPWRAWE